MAGDAVFSGPHANATPRVVSADILSAVPLPAENQREQSPRQSWHQRSVVAPHELAEAVAYSQGPRKASLSGTGGPPDRTGALLRSMGDGIRQLRTRSSAGATHFESAAACTRDQRPGDGRLACRDYR